MTPYQKEQVEVLRRIAERGKAKALNCDPTMLDLFQHMLDEIERLKYDDPSFGIPDVHGGSDY